MQQKLNILNLKIRQEDREKLWSESGIYPSFHMSQKIKRLLPDIGIKCAGFPPHAFWYSKSTIKWEMIYLLTGSEVDEKKSPIIRAFYQPAFFFECLLWDID